MSTAWQKHEDFAEKERRRRLWQRDQVGPDAVAIAAWIACGLICAAWVKILIWLVEKVAMWLKGVL